MVQGVEVDAVDAETQQACLRMCARLFGFSVVLRGNDDAVAMALQCLADDLFAPALSVSLCSVKVSDARVQRSVDDLIDEVLFEGASEVVAPERNGRDFERTD